MIEKNEAYKKRCKVRYFSHFFISLISFGSSLMMAHFHYYLGKNIMANNLKNAQINGHHHATVEKKVLKNGMTILVRPVHMIPKVSIQLWYGVGSKDEKDKERGIAHLIEHMIFKGTNTLSESDINVITHKLSGNCNAFTSYDYTGYLFNLPTHHWHEALPIMADCMHNATFKEDMLSSEMKAVVQELKMYRDRYIDTLVETMISTIFSEHPYHHPIIGYKQDLWSVKSADLKAFYKKHYVPNNATLVVVGDVDPQDVFAQAEKYFGDLQPNPEYKKETHYLNDDIVSKSVVLYRDIQQPITVSVFLVPGTKARQDHALSLLPWILAKGKSSRLHKILVDELHLASSVSASNEDLFDHGLFFVVTEPHSVEHIEKIEKIIAQEIQKLVEDGIEEHELTRALKQAQMDVYSLLEDIENQAYQVGKYFLATDDPNYVFTYLDKDPQEIKKDIEDNLKKYFRSTVIHTGKVLPLPKTEHETWAALQKLQDEQDQKILSNRERTTPVEPPSYANEVMVKQAAGYDFPKPAKLTLSNGLNVLAYHNDNTPKIDLILDFKAKHFYDPIDRQGLIRFISAMIVEGSENYSAQELAQIVEERGISISSFPGGIAMSMLTDDFVFGMEILEEILQRATFNQKEIEKVRGQMLTRLNQFWDEPRYFVGQLVKEHVYKNHPYAKNSLGTQDSIANITPEELKEGYEKFITPHGATLAIVGDLNAYNVKDVLEKTLGKWQGPSIEEITFPQLNKTEKRLMKYPINRDQVVLSFAGLSVDRKHPDYDKLLLFDQIFGGGALGSMSSRLFQLREQTGLFYGISGSLINGADLQPGMAAVTTIVSLDRLKEAQEAIKNTIDTVIDSITPEELAQAKNALVNSLVDHFASNYSMANAFLFLEKYNLPADFFDKRAQQYQSITLDEVKDAARNVLNSENMMTMQVGRV